MFRLAGIMVIDMNSNWRGSLSNFLNIFHAFTFSSLLLSKQLHSALLLFCKQFVLPFFVDLFVVLEEISFRTKALFLVCFVPERNVFGGDQIG